MVGNSTSSSSSSCASVGSFDDISIRSGVAGGCSVKLLCSYGGKILPRHTDGKLRYIGGYTRVLSIDRSVSFSDLQQKLVDLCGWPAASLRCQIPAEDLDALVSITSDEDLLNLFEEYDLASRGKPIPMKIRAFLHPPHPLPPPPPPAVASSCPHRYPVVLPSQSTSSAKPPPPPPAASRTPGRCVNQAPSSPSPISARFGRSHAGDLRRHAGCFSGGSHRPHHHLVHHGKQWQ